MTTSPGDSSVPARRFPNMTELAPAAMALVMSPEYLIPPSAIRGISFSLVMRKTSEIAVICGIPAPEIIRVVQIEPGPTPTFTASTPSAMSSLAASVVPMFPAMSSWSGSSFFIIFTVSMTFWEWPWAVSITNTSTFAWTKALALSRVSPLTPIAAPTLNRPKSSLQALGYWILFRMSLYVIKPLRWKFSSTIRSFSILCLWKSFSASLSDVPNGTVINSFVIALSIEMLSRVSNRMSRLVRIPTSLLFSSVIGRPDILYFFITSFASKILF